MDFAFSSILGKSVLELGEGRLMRALGAFLSTRERQTLRELVMPRPAGLGEDLDKAVAVRERTKSVSYYPQYLTFTEV